MLNKTRAFTSFRSSHPLLPRLLAHVLCNLLRLRGACRDWSKAGPENCQAGHYRWTVPAAPATVGLLLAWAWPASQQTALSAQLAAPTDECPTGK